MSLIDTTDTVDPVGRDLAVRAAALALEAAITAAARSGGRTLKSLAMVYVTQDSEDGFCGCLFVGDAAPEVTGFMAETLLDDSADIDLADMLGRLN